MSETGRVAARDGLADPEGVHKPPEGRDVTALPVTPEAIQAVFDKIRNAPWQPFQVFLTPEQERRLKEMTSE